MSTSKGVFCNGNTPKYVSLMIQLLDMSNLVILELKVHVTIIFHEPLKIFQPIPVLKKKNQIQSGCPSPTSNSK